MDLLALLFILGISLASGNDVKSAPEDLDGSGDDEDFSGSGMDFSMVDGDDLTTMISPLVTTATQVSSTQEPDIAVEEETEENVTQHAQTTKPHDPIEDIFAIDPVEKDPLAEEGTTLQPTTHQTSFIESDVKKHHHHHTTTPVTSLPPKFVVEKTTTSPEVEKPFVIPEESVTSTPDEGDSYDVTPTPKGPVHHVHAETTSGLTSTLYAENEETTAGTADFDEIPVLVDSMDESTVTEEIHAHKPHHHTSTTAIPSDGSDFLIVPTENPNYVEPEDLDQQGEVTSTPSEDKHEHEHHHHKHHHHHTTTPKASETEQFIVHTQEPKGRRINFLPAETTAVIPVLSEDEETIGSPVQNNSSVVLTPDEDTLDSTEEESGNGPVAIDDLYIEQATAPVDKSDRMAPVPGGDGSSGASHGIMERTDLLAGIIAGGLAGLVFAASLVAFVFYRMKKKDEGSYSLEEPKQSNGGYQKPREQREFYA